MGPKTLKGLKKRQITFNFQFIQKKNGYLSSLLSIAGIKFHINYVKEIDIICSFKLMANQLHINYINNC